MFHSALLAIFFKHQGVIFLRIPPLIKSGLIPPPFNLYLRCHFEGPIFSLYVKIRNYFSPWHHWLLFYCDLQHSPLSGNYVTSFPFQTAVSFHSVINSTRTALLQLFVFYFSGANKEKERFSIVHCCNPHIWSITGLKDEGHMYLFPVLNM